MMPNKHDQKAMYVVSILPRVLCGNKFLYGKALFSRWRKLKQNAIIYLQKKTPRWIGMCGARDL